ncbi:MAG: exosortase-associated EpsI family protein [Planctomycetota bacterium]
MTPLQPTPSSPSNRQPFSGLTWIAPVLSASLLGGMILHALGLPEPADAGPYHNALLEIRDDTPLKFGDWAGRDEQVAEAAIQLLNPNLIISRQFANERTLERVSLLIVQCKDARDLNGHWPPNCYPAAGFLESRSEPAQWTMGDRVLDGREYFFGRDNIVETMVVSNFLIIPDGQVSDDMGDVVEAAGNYGLRYFGAAQVQVLTDAGMTPERRQAVVEEFLAAYRPLIEAIRYSRESASIATAG